MLRYSATCRRGNLFSGFLPEKIPGKNVPCNGAEKTLFLLNINGRSPAGHHKTIGYNYP